jgi:hypothetical protein
MISKESIYFYDTDTTTFTANFTVNLSSNAAWAINTFIVITGECNSTCFTCIYSSAPTGCITCVNLLAKASDNSCSLCLGGFYYINASQCGKCPITCKTCVNTSGVIGCIDCSVNL